MTIHNRWYTEGTIAVEAGSTTVVGAALAFTNQARAGDTLLIRSGPNAGLLMEVSADPATDLALEIDSPWPGVTQAGLSYAIIPTSTKRSLATDIHANLSQLRGRLMHTFRASEQPSDLLGADGSIAIDGVGGRYWLKEGGAWGAPVSMLGEVSAAQLSSAIDALKGGASAPYDTLKKLEDALAAMNGGASAPYATLKAIEDKLAPVLAGADASYDTFAELFAYVSSDMAAAAAINAALANRVRFDAAQGLTEPQKEQARSNIGAIGGAPPAAFVELTDTPATFAGAAGRVVSVNAGADGLEFVGAAGFVAKCVPGTDDFSIVNYVSGPGTICKWSNIAFDSAGGYVPATGVYTIPKAGKWAVFGVIDVTGDANCNYAALACLPGAAADLSVLYGFARTGIKSVVGSPTLFSVVNLAAGATLKFSRYYFATGGGVATVINTAVLPSSFVGAVWLGA